MTMKKFITCFSAITVMLFFLQNHLVASLSPIHQKTALFHFKQSLTIGTPTNCSYISYSDSYVIPSHPKTMNWSMNSDHCTWDGVSCDHNTGDVIGLDLSCSQLEGAILPNSTLFQLSHLRFLNLSWNDFSLTNQFPQEFGSFAKGLTHLNLSFTWFSGRVPSGISHLYKLLSLDLSNIYDLNNDAVKLEKEVFKSILQNLTQLRVLNLNGVNISSVLRVNLSTSLRVLDLRNTGIHGVLPQEVFHLPNIELLAFGGSNSYYEETGLQAELPKVKWGSSGTLQHLSLLEMDIYGGIPDSIQFLESLVSLGLLYCNLSGPIPRSIGNLGQLTLLGLGHNNLKGPIPTVLTNLTNLTYLDLSYNNFSGPFLSSVAHFKGLVQLDLSCNGFTGLLPTGLFSLPSLEGLSLSHNGFTGQLYESNSSKSQLMYFDCRSNLLNGRIPQSLFQLVNLNYLDISYNEFEGEIPHWIGSMGLNYLNLSYNRLTGGIEQLPWNNIQYLDLQSNKLSGSLPTLICDSSFLQILNLANNTLSGVLPICQTNLTRLLVFDLRMNQIQGHIPAALSNFRNLETLNLNGNKLEGRIPSSFVQFDRLRVLDLGNNQISDTFPQCLEGLPLLQVLVLKSNKFHGLINKSSEVEHPFPRLRIIDLSNNEFSGPLPTTYFQNFKAMMIGDVNERKATYIEHDLSRAFYSDSTALVIKGVETKLVRILTLFTTIDVSRNNFEGKIPEITGKLVLLRYLNLSHNYLRGHIPTSIGKLSVLESLDLSFNQLEGEIPQQLTSINTLARLNLSCNQLDGQIPKGSQFNTFDNDSYVGNIGLCGFPLSKECGHDIEMQKEGEDDDYFFSGFTLEAVVIGYGCGVVPAFIIGNLMLLAGKPKWFAGIIARELGLKIRRMEIRMR